MSIRSVRILQVVPALETGGAERTAVDIGAAIVERGWTSLVASAGGRLVEQLEREGSRHITLPLESKSPITLWRNATALTGIIRENGVDLIHARSRAPAWSSLLAARRCAIPFVTTYHGAYNQKNAAKAFYNSVMARADVVIANSQWTADLIGERHPSSKDRIVPIARGTDLDAFNPKTISQEDRAKLLRQWGVEQRENRFLIVNLARLTEWKGQRVVIEAAAQMVKSNPEVLFVLAGGDQGRSDYSQDLRRLIARHELHSHVLLPGHCDQPESAMAVADAVVVASIEAEAFGRAAVEAGALERPVIVTRIGAVGETVLAPPDVGKNKRTGWKVAPGSADEMAQALREVMELPPDEREAIGRRARHRASQHFSLQAMSEKTLAIYERLLEPQTRLD